LDLKFPCELARDDGSNFKSTFKIHAQAAAISETIVGRYARLV
jgi:hypothetical protein